MCEKKSLNVRVSGKNRVISLILLIGSRSQGAGFSSGQEQIKEVTINTYRHPLFKSPKHTNILRVTREIDGSRRDGQIYRPFPFRHSHSRRGVWTRVSLPYRVGERPRSVHRRTSDSRRQRVPESPFSFLREKSDRPFQTSPTKLVRMF